MNILNRKKLEETVIRKMIEDHQHYILRDVPNYEEYRADFTGIEFPCGFEFKGSDLSKAIFNNTSLACASFEHCNLIGTDFTYADFHMAFMVQAKLDQAFACNADFSRATLREASFVNTTLNGALLARADLSFATFKNAELTNVDMSYSDLSHATVDTAYIHMTDFKACDLEDIKKLPDDPIICPEVGSFIGFKKATDWVQDYIVTLRITEDAYRTNAVGSSKCRCDKAEVIAIERADGKKDKIPVTEVHSFHKYSFVYKLGEIVTEPNCDKNRAIECGEGIHFFMHKDEAMMF